MKRTHASLLGLALCLPSCAYTNIVVPLDTDVDNTTLGDKTGRADNQSILWLVAWGDAGLKAAAQNGGITTMTHADMEVLQVLFGLYTRTTTIVYGK